MPLWQEGANSSHSSRSFTGAAAAAAAAASSAAGKGVSALEEQPLSATAGWRITWRSPEAAAAGGASSGATSGSRRQPQHLQQVHHLEQLEEPPQLHLQQEQVEHQELGQRSRVSRSSIGRRRLRRSRTGGGAAVVSSGGASPAELEQELQQLEVEEQWSISF